MRPPDQDIARAVRYVTHEFVLDDGRIDLEMLAEGFAFGRCEPDKYEIEEIATFAPEFTAEVWAHVLARADFLRAAQGLCPLSERKERMP